jgi:hypothetical protein
MRFLLSLTLTAALAAALLAPTASAATEFGDTCTANEEFFAPITFFEASAPANPLPIAAPSAGVLTKWKVNLIPEVPVTFPQTLKVLRLNTASHTALVVGETTATIASGANVINARIPVQAGDRLSIFGSGLVETLICVTPGEESLIGGFEGNGGGTGSTNPYIELPEEFRVPVAAVIEPDADSDGFGDETQDGCPQSAAFQTPCPVVKVDASSVIKRKGSVIVLVTTDSSAPVKVTGTAKLGKGQKAKLSGPTKTVAPGKIARFTLKFPKKLKDKLGDLTKKQSLQLKVNARATDLVGRVTKDSLKTRLKGQG